MNYLLVSNIVDVIKNADWPKAVGLGIFYIFFTMLGAISAHVLALNVEAKKGITT